MRELGRFALATVVVLAVGSMASAATTFWFEAAPNNATSSVTTQGDGANALALECDVSGGTKDCSWNITMFAMVGPGPGPGGAALNGYSLDLHSPDSPNKVTQTAPVFTGGFPPFPGTFLNLTTFIGAINLPGKTMAGYAGAGIGVPVSPGLKQLMSFNLDKVGPAGPNVTTLDGVVGQFGMGFTGGGFEQVNMGGSGAVLGAPGAFMGTAITITNVPEPGTIGMLVVGALMLIRRRR